MAAPQRYPTPHQQLRELAEMALLDGTPFDVFWDRAMRPGRPPITWQVPEEDRPPGCVVWPRDTFDRNVSLTATRGAREGWRRAYEDVAPTGPEVALLRLAPWFDALAAQQAELVAEGLELLSAEERVAA